MIMPKSICSQASRKFNALSWIEPEVTIGKKRITINGFLTNFKPQASFYIPWKHQENKSFLMISEGIDRDQCREIS